MPYHEYQLGILNAHSPAKMTISQCIKISVCSALDYDVLATLVL